MDKINLITDTIIFRYGGGTYTIPIWLVILIATSLFILLVLVFIALPVKKARFRKFYFFKYKFPDITDEETERYTEKMTSIFSELWNTYKYDNDVFSIEIYKVQEYVIIQIGTNNKKKIEALKKSFASIANSEPGTLKEDSLKSFRNFKGKSIQTTLPYFAVKNDKQFFENVLNYLSLLKYDKKKGIKEQAGIQFVLRGVNKRTNIRKEQSRLFSRNKGASQKTLIEGKENENEVYERKLEENLFKVKINVIGNTQKQVDNLASKFACLNYANNKLVSKPLSNKEVIYRYNRPEKVEAIVNFLSYWTLIFRDFLRKGSYLTSSEVTCLFHPTQVFRGAYAPQQIKMIEANPDFMNKLDKEHLTIGNGKTAEGKKFKVTFPIKNFERHIYIVGMTGKGKSTLIETEVMEITQKQNKTLFVFDPHGEMLERIALRINNPQDIVYLNVQDQNMIYTFNPLFCFRKSREWKVAIVDTIFNILKHEVKEQAGIETSGAATFNLIRKILGIGVEFADAYFNYLTSEEKIKNEEAEKLVNRKQITLNDLTLFLSKSYTYQQMLKKVFKDYSSLVSNYVTKELTKDSKMHSVTSAVKARFEPLLHPSVKAIVEGNKMNIENVIRSGKTFLMPMQASVFGEVGARSIQQLFASIAWLSKRSTLNENHELYLFCDEVQNMQISLLPQILSEARKFKLYLTIAHQYFRQLREEIIDAILGNAGTIISFTLSPDEAERIAKMFGSRVSVEDLAKLPKYSAYLRTEGEEDNPLAVFSFTTIKQPDISINKATLQNLNQRSLTKYGEKKADIYSRLERKSNDAFEYFMDHQN